ncbi:MAG: hypothetical protein GF347_01750 [Candidatus Moranbacteria bacterium]|nr:hypothetical protein [Candidatus Moranbacteria bacterium]
MTFKAEIKKEIKRMPAKETVFGCVMNQTMVNVEVNPCYTLEESIPVQFLITEIGIESGNTNHLWIFKGFMGKVIFPTNTRLEEGRRIEGFFNFNTMSGHFKTI